MENKEKNEYLFANIHIRFKSIFVIFNKRINIRFLGIFYLSCIISIRYDSVFFSFLFFSFLFFSFLFFSSLFFSFLFFSFLFFSFLFFRSLFSFLFNFNLFQKIHGTEELLYFLFSFYNDYGMIIVLKIFEKGGQQF